MHVFSFAPVRPLRLLVRLGPITATLLVCGGCVAQPVPPSEPVINQVEYRPDPNDPNCCVYTAQATVNGVPQQIVGRACRQPDGTWRIVEGTPGQPEQYVAIYGPPPYTWYPDYCPWGCDWWWWGPPIGLSLGTFVVVDRDHHFRQFHHFHGFAFDGPRGSFLRTFGGGFRRDHGLAFGGAANPGFAHQFGGPGFAHRFGGMGVRPGFARGGFHGGMGGHRG